MPRTTTAKRYCFTLNNYTDDEEAVLRASLSQHCSYAIVGREVGESGTPHLQGYCILNKRASFDTAKDRINPRSHVEVSNGTPRQNELYCRKGGDYWEHGDCPDGGPSSGRSARDDLARAFVDAANSGRVGLHGFAHEHPGAYYYSRHQLLRNWMGHQQPISRPDIRVDWYYGPPGVGKSRRAHGELPSAYIKDPRTKWWNGYMLEPDVIIDDFGPQGIDINHLLRWFDRYKCTVEVKGDCVPLLADHFIVTSNFHPSEVFSSHVSDPMDHTVREHPQLPALMRRINLTFMGYEYDSKKHT
ncbi:MAG: helicase [Anthevirus perseuis]|uniref:Replication-associated protein n=1 Tax=Cressdnaviricota sp. TaxID=2748378 RepID=A0A345BP69_9VIRU|nr:MAG: helicase [Cressdnaviricota sp.]